MSVHHLKQKKLILKDYSEHLRIIANVPFTSREIDIIACVLNGRAAKKIGILLSISPKTVENHIRNIMIKLRCGSQENIRDFIEKSGRFTFFKKHYAYLIIHSDFKKQLKKIGTFIVDPIQCLLLHNNSKEDESSITRLEYDLAVLGIKATCLRWDNKIDQTNCFEVMSSKSMQCLLYIVSPEFKKQLLMSNHIDENIKAAIDSTKTAAHFFFTVTAKSLNNRSPLNYANQMAPLDENYYFSFFNLIKTILPALPIDNICSEFERLYSSLQEEPVLLIDGKSKFNHEPEETKISLKNFSIKTLNLLVKRQKTKLIFVLTAALLSLALVSININKGDHAHKSGDELAMGLGLIEKEYKSALETTNEIINTTDLLELKPRILLLSEDIDQYLEKHQRIDAELTEKYKGIQNLIETIHSTLDQSKGMMEWLFSFIPIKSEQYILKQKFENELNAHQSILQAIIALNRCLLLYMSNISYSPSGQSTSNYDLALEELDKVFYLVGTKLVNANNSYLHYFSALSDIIGKEKLFISKRTKKKNQPLLDKNHQDTLSKCFFIALQNYAMILRTQGDIGDSPANIQKRKKEILITFENNKMFEKINRDEESIQILSDFYLENDFSQNVYRKAFKIFELANSFNNDFLLQINYTPILLSQTGEVVKRLFNEANATEEQINALKAIDLHEKAYLQNNENIIVLNGYAKALVDRADLHVKHLKDLDVEIQSIVKIIHTIFKKLDYSFGKRDEFELEDIVKLKNEFVMKFSGNDSDLIAKARQHLDKMVSLTLKKHDLQLELYRCFDVAERTFRYALSKCERGNAILEVNLSHLLFMKSLYLQEAQGKNDEAIIENIQNIQGGRKDEHKTLLFHKATLQIILKKYKEALDTLYRYEFLAGHMRNPYLLYLRGVAKFGVEDYEGAKQDFAKALKIADLHTIYFSERGYRAIIRFDETIITPIELRDTLLGFVQNVDSKTQFNGMLRALRTHKINSHFFKDLLEISKQ